MVSLVELKWFHIQFRGDHEVVSDILQVLVDFFFINLYHRFYLFPVLIPVIFPYILIIFQ